MSVNKYEEANRRHWNEVTPVHAQSEEFYGLEAFRNGESTLCREEITDVGPVEGKSLLHLQCHFGMDTLSWARLGARVTGMDISDASIDEARKLASDLGLDAHFVRCSLYELPDALQEQFDIVYTGRGALLWLHDLNRWAEIVAHFLKPGGFLYLMETHPSLNMFDNQKPGQLCVDGHYFHQDEPERGQPGQWPDYANPEYIPRSDDYEWKWSLEDILTALRRAGLTLLSFREYDRLFFQAFPGMVREDKVWWRLPGFEGRVPMTMSLIAGKPGGGQETPSR